MLALARVGFLTKWILAGRLLLLFVMAGALVAAVVATGRQGSTSSPRTGVYRCSMHPAVVSPIPAECPICRMPLLRGMAPAVSIAGRTDPSTFSLPAAVTSLPGFQVAQPGRLPVARRSVVPASLTAGDSGIALFYRDELEGLETEEQAVFIPGEIPARLRRDSKPAVSVRFELARPSASRGSRAGSAGWLRLPPRNLQPLLIPAGAVLRSPDGPFVLVAIDQEGTPRTFSRRPVALGRVVFGFATVLGGVRESDRVVIGSAFFLDAERRLGIQSEETGKARP